MKKILTLFLVLTLALIGTGAPMAAGAISPVEGCTIVRDFDYQLEDGNTWELSAGQSVDVEENEGAGAVVCVINMINRVANFFFYLMIVLVVALVIMGAFFILTAGPREGHMEKGKKYITFAIIGILVAIFAYTVPFLISFIVS